MYPALRAQQPRIHRKRQADRQQVQIQLTLEPIRIRSKRYIAIAKKEIIGIKRINNRLQLKTD